MVDPGGDRRRFRAKALSHILGVVHGLEAGAGKIQLRHWCDGDTIMPRMHEETRSEY